jgi:hypothetical protein
MMIYGIDGPIWEVGKKAGQVGHYSQTSDLKKEYRCPASGKVGHFRL